jgi:hypothetical protein
MKNKQIDGYYIMGTYQSCAWYKNEDEAKAMCKKMNHGRDYGTYRVEPSYKH